MLESFLENSRLAKVIQQVEAGETVDLEQVLTLQALDIARVGELFALESITAEKEANDRLEQQLGELGN